jgi:hypothetical protein
MKFQHVSLGNLKPLSFSWARRPPQCLALGICRCYIVGVQQEIYDKDNFEYGPIHHGALPGIWSPSGLIHSCKEQAKIELGVARR